MALATEVRREGLVAIVELTGKITLGDASQSVRGAVDKLVDDGCCKIVLNLKGVPFIDSAGLGALTMGYTKTKGAGGSVKLAEVQSRVKDALEMTRLTKILPLFETEREAVESFEQANAVGSASPAQ